MFRSETYGEVDIKDIPKYIHKFYTDHLKYGVPVHIIVGTDSQNFSLTKMVSVVAVVCEGHGGIFFYEITNKPLIMDIRKKLHEETYASLQIAAEIVGIMEETDEFEDMYLNCPVAIHVDAGNSAKNKTKELIPELVGWIKSFGYDCEIKPESFVASSIADKYSK